MRPSPSLIGGVLYAAPNRAHHYTYAGELARAGLLVRFVTGVSRFAPHGAFPEIGNRLVRADLVQNAYLAALRLGAPKAVSSELAYLSKLWIDSVCRRHLDDTDTFLFYNGCGLQTARECRRRGITTVVEAVNSHVLVQQNLLRQEYEAAGLAWRPFHRHETTRRVAEYEAADFILTPSEFVRRSFIAQGVAAERILKVPYRVRRIPGTAASDYDVHGKSDGAFRILYVGSVSLRKGLRYLVEAFRAFQHPRKELWIVGPEAPSTGLEGISLPEGVTFHGTLKGRDLLAAYQSASVFCLPTIEEGLALVLAEALANGLPVLATENSGASDLFRHGEEGYILPIRDAGAIHEALKELAGNADLRERMASKARLRAGAMFAQAESEEVSPLASALGTLTAKP